MNSIEDVDLTTFCGRIGNLYVRFGLSPPFALYDAARGWMARDIPHWHCVDVIERYLAGYGRSCPSGSGDRNFAWLNSLIQTTWYERSFASPPRPASSRHHDWLHEPDAEEPNQRRGRGAAFAAGPPNSVSKADSFELDRVGLRQKTAKSKSACPRQIRQARSTASKSSGRTLARTPKKIDVAVTWLRAELANGERAAAEVEAKALCVGIAPRTYDRARKLLGVASRRISFGRWAKYMIALPVVDRTPSEAANRAGAT
jgi:hypothetical protein